MATIFDSIMHEVKLDVTPLFDKGIGSVVSNTSVEDDVVRARCPFEYDQIARSIREVLWQDDFLLLG